MNDSAHEMALFMWGKSSRRWRIYKVVPLDEGDVSGIRDLLEAR